MSIYVEKSINQAVIDAATKQLLSQSYEGVVATVFERVKYEDGELKGTLIQRAICINQIIYGVINSKNEDLLQHSIGQYEFQVAIFEAHKEYKLFKTAYKNCKLKLIHKFDLNEKQVTVKYDSLTELKSILESNDFRIKDLSSFDDYISFTSADELIEEINNHNILTDF